MSYVGITFNWKPKLKEAGDWIKKNIIVVSMILMCFIGLVGIFMYSIIF